MTEARLTLRPLASTMTDTPTFSSQSITDVDVASAFADAQPGISALDQSTIRDETNAVILVRQIRPDSVIEDMRLDRVDDGRQGHDRFRLSSVFEGGSVNGHRAEVVQVRVGNKEGVKQIPEDMKSFCTRRAASACDTRKGAIS